MHFIKSVVYFVPKLETKTKTFQCLPIVFGRCRDPTQSGAEVSACIYFCVFPKHNWEDLQDLEVALSALLVYKIVFQTFYVTKS